LCHRRIMLKNAMSNTPFAPASSKRGNSQTWVKSQWKNPAFPGHFSVEINSHDSGNDLIVPLQASNGAGFAVMDGGTVASPGVVVPAMAAARIDATHVSVTLSQAITNPSSSVLFFYPYGSTQIGRGDAVTDNAGSIAAPANWSIGQDLGSDWVVNLPLQATTYPITLSDVPV
ncbi:MAG: hypothetical protein KGH70_07500, partial [Rhodospirillales bacterium]|nr:hypothetical protein [Rhodospirillales bacterium]